uniref:Uncharacterized protein n=1 Tax=Fagus sylvatica TaxID=28930 RepID=A0A2N9EVU0_FAGSY
MDPWLRLGWKWSDCSMGNFDLTIAMMLQGIYIFKLLRRQYNDTKVLEQSHSFLDETGEMNLWSVTWKDFPGHATNDCSRAHWTPSKDCYVRMLEEVHRGKKMSFQPMTPSKDCYALMYAGGSASREED